MEQIERGPRIGVPDGARVIRPSKAIEDPLTEEEKAVFEKVVGPAPAPFPMSQTPQALVVEDDPFTRSHLIGVVKQWDLEVIEAANGTDALKALGSRRIDFILVDLKLPGHDGYEVIRCARSYVKLRQTEIVAMAETQEKKDEIAALNLGADIFFYKPVPPDLLQARLKPLVRRLYDRLGG